MGKTENSSCFNHFGTMLDCSRNAVMNVESIKKWIDITTDLGYNTLLLYTEDTYEVKDNPYFGYMRGRYRKEELKEINAYALSKGMELIPCIQTLAHMNAIIRWPAYREHVDTDDILLAGDKAVYELIDKMFATIPIRSIMIKCLLPTQRLRRIPGLLVAFGTGRDSHLIMATV